MISTIGSAVWADTHNSADLVETDYAGHVEIVFERQREEVNTLPLLLLTRCQISLFLLVIPDCQELSFLYWAEHSTVKPQKNES